MTTFRLKSRQSHQEYFVQMRIYIESTMNDAVQFSSLSGCGYGLWKGKTPPVETECDVEVELSGDFLWGSNVMESNLQEASIQTHKEYTTIVAEVVSIENDLLAVDLSGTIIMLEATHMPSTYNGYVSIVTREIRLYPFEV